MTAWPFVKSARLLSAEGHPADAVIEMWRPNTDEWVLRGRLGAVAATVIDGETASRLRQEWLAGSRSREERSPRGLLLVHVHHPRAVSGAADDNGERGNVKPLGERRTIQMLARPTAMQEQAFALLGVPPPRVQ